MSSLDEKLVELKTITEKLEKDETSLDESLVLFDKGVELAKDCYKVLNETKGKITVLKQDLEVMKEEQFD